MKNILVACNNRNKEWCPYGTEDCECDVYYPHEHKNDEDKYYTCMDKNDKEQQCYLEEVIEDLNPVKELSYIQCAACGYKSSKEKFFNSSVHSKFKICPICGTVKFVCEENRHYRKNGDTND